MDHFYLNNSVASTKQVVVISCENMEKIIINSGFFLIVNHNSSNFFYSVDSVLRCMYNYVFLNEIISKMSFFLHFPLYFETRYKCGKSFI